jgi:flagellar biosynthesis/type III secretory pathway chaperone
MEAICSSETSDCDLHGVTTQKTVLFKKERSEERERKKKTKIGKHYCYVNSAVVTVCGVWIQ